MLLLLVSVSSAELPYLFRLISLVGGLLNSFSGYIFPPLMYLCLRGRKELSTSR